LLAKNCQLSFELARLQSAAAQELSIINCQLSIIN